MAAFLYDFELGRTEGRYKEGELPELPFEDRRFDLALCSHFLFLYSEQFSTEFHLRSMIELCRVATGVRVFPLLELNGERSRHLTHVQSELSKSGVDLHIATVNYEFQKGGNKLLVASAR